MCYVEPNGQYRSFPEFLAGLTQYYQISVTVKRYNDCRNKKTGFTPRQVNNALYKLKQKGKIESISNGVYVKKES